MIEIKCKKEGNLSYHVEMIFYRIMIGEKKVAFHWY